MVDANYIRKLNICMPLHTITSFLAPASRNQKSGNALFVNLEQ